MPITTRGLSRARALLAPALCLALAAGNLSAQSAPDPSRPFGTLREQAERQQAWLKERLDSILPGLMRKYGIDMWVVPMREYNEDPVFSALVSPTTFAARRRTIYVFFDRGPSKGVERIALGGSSQGGLYDAVRSTKQVTASVGGRQAELWGDQQWQVLKDAVETRKPRVIAIDMWVVPMREYNEDPVFPAIVSPETFYARRRTIYVFFDSCAAKGAPPVAACVQRIALGGTSQGGVFDARRSTAPASAAIGRGQQAELWGDEQWQALKKVVEERNPQVIGIDRSTVFAFSDGLSSGELKGMSAALGEKWSSRFRDAEGLPLELIAVRLPEEEAFYQKMQELVWSMTQEMFSAKTITPGTTRTSDVVWWWRQRVNDLGLGTWFQPSIEVQRKGVGEEKLGNDPIIERGDVLHCDVGITVARLNTDTQHMAYVLRQGETEAPEGLRRALSNANALQDFTMEEIRPGRTGNEILSSVLARMKAKNITGSLYTHPIGLNGHGAGPLIGLWDYQDGVPGRGDAKVIPSMWFSIELQATTPVPEWDGQAVRMAQEEDAIVAADGKIRWAIRRQDQLFLVR